VVGVFIAEQDEPAKIWNLVVVLLATAITAASLWNRRKNPLPKATIDRRLVKAVLASLLVVVVGLLVNPFYASGKQSNPEPPPSSESSSSRPVGDVRMHEIWASSAENVARTLPKGSWAATDFQVRQPYLRSVEVAAGADGLGKLQLTVYDEHQQELASGEAVVENWRAKYTFEMPIDISAHLGKRLFLVARNIWPEPVRVYFTRNDRSPDTSSYVSCGQERVIQCPNPQARDLSAIVVGRWEP
jgi:hypothetical protein